MTLQPFILSDIKMFMPLKQKRLAIMEQGNIKAIDYTSIHKICSGQVVLTLAVAVKELVENSIDAGADSVDILLEEHGSKLVEVSDNGKGVKATDFQNLTLKHHTSKIADFSDLPFVSTFGFRGEALSSLCALSDLEITTRHIDAEVATNLKFDHSGNLIKSTPIARQIGTTVILRNIFSTYPVRHKEFIRHVRREFSKMIQLLTAYCLISVNKRITCVHITEKGKKNIVLSTHNSKSWKENIVSLFGDKQMKQLMEIKRHDPSDEILKEYFLPESSVEKSNLFSLGGYVSNSTHGEGRSSSDRQFFFISGRPCDLPKISKLINEIYHTFNKHQYPFVLLNISLVEGFADVNVTPDKRQIFIPDEKVLLALIKSSLLNMYGSQPAQNMMSSLNFISIKKDSDSISTFSSLLSGNNNSKEQTETKKRKFEIPSLGDDDKEEEKNSVPCVFKSQKLNFCVESSQPNQKESQEMNLLPNHISTKTISNENSCQSQKNRIDNETVNFTLTLPFNEEKYLKKVSPKKTGIDKLKAVLDAARKSSNKCDNLNFQSLNKNRCKNAIPNNNIGKFSEKDYIFSPVPKVSEEFDLISYESESLSNKDHRKGSKICNEIKIKDVSFDEPTLRKKKYKTILFSMDLLVRKIHSSNNEKLNTESCSFRKFRSKILPSDNQTAEEELKKEISKDSFSEMEIIGQFNLGFIITSLKDDLFIIDQHATDEKFNFETLQKETILETQKLFKPLPLNLTAASEAILLDNMNIFLMNGFKFQINEDNPSGEKIQLLSVPVSQNWSFGKEDVDELIFMLTDNPIRMVRPSRVNQMLASRACRKSVMIGTAITIPMMKKLVTHMGEIEQPWNCPHGRPTMRHLFNLKLL